MEIITLPNNLRVLLVPMEEASSVTVMAIVGTGSRYETKKNEGLAHFYEHMVFKGTQKYPDKKAIALAVDNIGAEYNGSTAQEYTAYYVKGAARDLTMGLDLVSQLLIYPLLADDEVGVERKVILEELHMYYDVPRYRAEIELQKLLFPQHPLGKCGLGTAETISNFGHKDFLAFQKKFYTADKTVLVLAGKIGSEKKTIEKVKKYFGAMKTGKLITFEPISNHKERKEVSIKKETDQIHLALGVRALSWRHRRRFEQKLLNVILGKGMSSRLFQSLREKRGLCYAVYSSLESFADTGILEIAAGVNKTKKELAVEEIKKQLSLLTTEFVGKEELIKAKNFIRGKLALVLEDSYGKALFYGKQILLRNSIREPSELLREIEKVDRPAILSLSKELFKPENIRLVSVGN